jgi:GrpB-like predicted nucleotidyltransferase (UPF0157 family)
MTDRSMDPSTPATGMPRLHTEAEIQAASVDILEPLTGPITLVDYDPRWPGLFAREEARIRSILGDRVVEIEHTGSTSVPGLAAKPIIDITMTVADVAAESAYAADLEAAGYRLVIREQEPDWYDHRVFKGPDTNINLHVFSHGCRELDRMVGLRDWLRAHDDDRQLYEDTKRDLVRREWKYVQNHATRRAMWSSRSPAALALAVAIREPPAAAERDTALTPRPAGRTVRDTQMNALFYFRSPA